MLYLERLKSRYSGYIDDGLSESICGSAGKEIPSCKHVDGDVRGDGKKKFRVYIWRREIAEMEEGGKVVEREQIVGVDPAPNLKKSGPGSRGLNQHIT